MVFNNESKSSEESKHILHLTDSDFEDVIGIPSAGPTKIKLVMFHMPNCYHCVKFAPTLNVLADELHEEFTFAKYDITKNKEFKTLYKIRGAPTLILFKDSLTYDILNNRDINHIKSEMRRLAAGDDEL